MEGEGAQIDRAELVAPPGNKCPLFSVIIPTYRRPALLERAVESVANQVFRSFEIIVIDDGSGPSWDYARVEKRSDVRMVRNARNRGVATARNCGIALARGRYVCFLDDDDEYESEFLSNMSVAVGRDGEATAFVWCGVRFIAYEEGIPRNDTTIRAFPSSYQSNEDLYGEALSIGSGFGLTIRRDFFAKIGMFDESLRVTEDTDLIIRLVAANSPASVLEEVLVNVHNHDGDRLTSSTRNDVRLGECALLLKRYEKFFGANPRYRLQLERHMTELARTQPSPTTPKCEVEERS